MTKRMQDKINQANEILFKYEGTRLHDNFTKLLSVFDNLPENVKVALSFYSEPKIKARIKFPSKDFIFDLFPDKMVLVGSWDKEIYQVEELKYRKIRDYMKREFPKY